MDRFKRFAMSRPFLFGLSLVLIYAFVATFTYPIHYLFPEDNIGQLYGDGFSKAIAFIIFLFILWRFGWLRASGLTRIGSLWLWLVVGAVLIYKTAIELYAFTGAVSLIAPPAELTIATAIYYFFGSLVEESMYRSLTLIAMILAWGATKRGIVKSIILSSLIFGLLHMFNILAKPLDLVLLQVAIVTIPGILYAALVLKGKSLWTVVIIHWITNTAVNLRLSSIENFQETTEMWLTLVLLLIPIVAYSAYLIWNLPSNLKYAYKSEIAQSEMQAQDPTFSKELSQDLNELKVY